MSKHSIAVAAAASEYRRAKKALEEARSGVESAVVAALRAGERPTDVAGWSPFTATYVRKLARANGVEAPGRPSSR